MMPDTKHPSLLDEHARELLLYLDSLVRRMVATRRDSTAFEALSRQEFSIVDALGTHGPMLVRDVADRLRLPLSTVSTATNQLAAKRLARREPLATDRRLVQLELTSAGFTLYHALLETRLQVARHTLRALDAAERPRFLQLLRKALTMQ